MHIWKLPVGESNVICPVCRESLVLSSSITTISRGDRSVTVETSVMACPHGHPDPAAPEHGVYAIVTDAQAREFYMAVDGAWKRLYGEVMPVGNYRSTPKGVIDGA